MFFKKVKLARSINRVIEDSFYEQVALEMEKGDIKLGTWTRAKANAEGDNDKTEALYIKYRVQYLHDAINATEVVLDEASKVASGKKVIEYDALTLEKERKKQYKLELKKNVSIKEEQERLDELEHQKAYQLEKERKLKRISESKKQEALDKKRINLTHVNKIKPYLDKYKHIDIGDTNDLESLKSNYLLHKAVWKGDVELVIALLSMGFDPGTENNDGHTAYELSVGDSEMKKVLNTF